MKFTLEARVTPESLERHCLCIGASGSGKSLELKAMARSIINATNTPSKRASVVILDPHADVTTSIMALRELDPKRLLYISTTIQKESNWQHGQITPVFNPFQLPKDADESFKHTLASQLTNTIAEMVDTGQYGITINMHMLLLPAILVTLSSDNPCFDTLKRLLTDGQNEQLLQIGINYPHPQIQDFFRTHWVSKDYDLTKRALISKINYILNNVTLYNLLNGKGADIDAHLEAGSVIIVNAPVGQDPFASNIVGRLMIAYIFSLMLRRSSKYKKNMPCYMIIDEMNSYADSSSLSDALRQSRKFGLRLILALQSLAALPTQLKSAIVTNTYLKLVSIADSKTHEYMSAELKCTTADLAKITPLMFMVARNDGGQTKPFRVSVPILNKHLFLTQSEIEARLRFVIEHSGAYTNVPPPSPPVSPAPLVTSKTKSRTKPVTNKPATPFGGREPGFTS